MHGHVTCMSKCICLCGRECAGSQENRLRYCLITQCFGKGNRQELSRDSVFLKDFMWRSKVYDAVMQHV